MNEDVAVADGQKNFAAGKWAGLKTVLCGGLIVGLLDGIFALVFYGMVLGVKTLRIFQSVAAGLLGQSSFDGGTQTFLLGVVLHFIVAACITAVYYLASLKLSMLIKRPVICGIVYGALAYLGMNYVVIPLSNAAPGKFSLMIFTVAVIGHALLVGLPIALITRYFSRNRI